MSKTPFSNQCVVLGGLWLFYRDAAKSNEAWDNFFQYNDVGLPLAYMIAEGIADASGDGQAEILVGETWEMFCEAIDIDPNGEYETIEDAWNASSQPPMENWDE